jgi:acyl carrier protein
MSREEILPVLKEIITPYLPDQSVLGAVTEQTHLINDLKINSANLVDVVLDAETRFNIMIDDESMEKMLTVGDCVSVIEKLLKTNAGG